MVWALGPAGQLCCLYSVSGLTLDEHGDRVWLLNILNESVLLLSERVLVDQSSPSKDIRCQVIDRVLRNTADTQLQPGLVS